MVTKSPVLRIVGTTITALVLLAVPAFAIGFSDLPTFSEGSDGASAVANLQDDGGSIVLTRWQFTKNTDHKTTHHKTTHHVQPPPPPPKTTHHKTTHHQTTHHKTTHHTNHKSQHSKHTNH